MALFLLLVIIVSNVLMILLSPHGKVSELPKESTEPEQVVVNTIEKQPVGRNKSNRDSTVYVRSTYKPRTTDKPYNTTSQKDTIKNSFGNANRYKPKQRPLSQIDLNSADSSLLVTLPGIGPYYASRIIRYREQLGGFYSTLQLFEINGLTDSVVQWFTVSDTVPVRKIDVNNASLAELRRHPYINFYQARAIVELRNERGKIKGPEQLSFVEEFTGQDLSRLECYLEYR